MILRTLLAILLWLTLLEVGAQSPYNNPYIKSATVSSPANYNRMKGGNSINKIFDGKFASASPMWLDQNTLGWQSSGTLIIDVEMKNNRQLTAVKLSTAANESASAFNPLSVSVFGSLDGEDFTYVGDIANRNHDNKNLYRKIELAAKNIQQNVKYIKIVVVPQGNLVFLDEVVIETAREKKGLRSSRQFDDVSKVVEVNRTTQRNKAVLINELESSNQSKSLGALKSEIINNPRIDQSGMEGYRRQIRALGQSKAEQQVAVRLIKNPWTLNDKIVYNNDKGFNIQHVHNLTSYIAFEINNNTANNYSPKDIKFEISGGAKIYEIDKVVTRTNKSVYDPLLPMDLDKVSIAAHETKCFMIELANIPKTTKELYVTVGGTKYTIAGVVSTDIGLSKEFINETDFNVNVWPYYSYSFSKGRETLVKNDLANHYSNTFVFAPWIMNAPNTVNKAEVTRQLQYYKTGDRVLLFLNFLNTIHDPSFLSDQWKSDFLRWYEEISDLMVKNGVDRDKLYLYPIDEIGGREVPKYNELISFIKKEIKDAKVFLTIFQGSVLKNITKEVDIFQVVVTNNDVEKITVPNTYWIYDIMDNSKDTDPEKRYRAMSWLAYRANATGVGLWNYAEQFGESIWDDSDGHKPDYHVVYDYNGQLASSLRWEAFKQGVEEYFLLKYAEDRIGTQAVRNIANKKSAYDELRKEIIQALSKR